MKAYFLSFFLFVSLGLSHVACASTGDSDDGYAYDNTSSIAGRVGSYAQKEEAHSYDLADPLSADDLQDKISKNKKKGFFKTLSQKIRKLSKGKQEIQNVKLCLAYWLVLDHGYDPTELCKRVRNDSFSHKRPQGLTDLLVEVCKRTAQEAKPSKDLPGLKACKALGKREKLVFLCKRLCNRVEYKKPGVWAQCMALKHMGICKGLKLPECVKNCDMPKKLSDVDDFLREAANQGMRYVQAKASTKTKPDALDLQTELRQSFENKKIRAQKNTDVTETSV
ncbi:MAG: hypothetical protein WCG05_02540 [Alphaproteobacteria bacterium]